jgi:arabinofuranosyltransferase
VADRLSQTGGGDRDHARVPPTSVQWPVPSYGVILPDQLVTPVGYAIFPDRSAILVAVTGARTSGDTMRARVAGDLRTSRRHRARRALGTGPIDWTTVGLLLVPIVFFAVMAWTHRWMADDGFINVHVVQQIFAGHGPVFNAGERVEAATSPLWILWLVVGKVVMFWLPIEWVAVLGGIAMTIVGLVLAAIAAPRAYRTRRLVPIGLIVFVVVPPAASYASSGLENGLTTLWIGAWYLALLRAADSTNGRAAVPAAVLIGLGPLVRPDLAVMSVVAGVALLFLDRPRCLRRAGMLIAVGLTLPVIYEIFRMCYYGDLLPNTAYAKEATGANWSQGWIYLLDFVRPYWLWVPAAILVVTAAVAWRHRRPSADPDKGLPVPDVGNERGSLGRDRVLVLATPAVAGLVYGFLVTRGGGDFMHGRMLLPALFALVLPVAAVPRGYATVLLACATVLWAIVPIVAGGPPYHGIGPQKIDDEPGLLATHARRANPVTLHDYSRSGFALVGSIERRQVEHGTRNLSFFLRPLLTMPLDPNGPAFLRDKTVYAIGAIGIVSVAAGPGVYIADESGLANPIGSRLRLPRALRVRHAKNVPSSWIVAMFADPAAPIPNALSAADVRAARRALNCPELAGLLERARAPLSISRAWTNFSRAITSFSTRIDPDPKVEASHCSKG